MNRMLRQLSLSLAALCLGAFGQTPAPKISAFDKPTFEAYVRHLNVWSAQIKVDIADPKPSDMPGFSLVTVHASAGGASADFQYYVSKDGQKVVQGNLYDISQNPFKADLDKLKTDLQPSFGTPGAPVVLVEFSDFECPMCKEEAKTLRDNLISTYPKEVRFYFMEFPLDQICTPGPSGPPSPGRCIFRQNANAFWDYHDWIFAHQDDIKADNLKDKVLEFAKGQGNRCAATDALHGQQGNRGGSEQSPSPGQRCWRRRDSHAVRQRPEVGRARGLAKLAQHHRLRDRLSKDRPQCGRKLRLRSEPSRPKLN
jgi:hypothetical protein